MKVTITKNHKLQIVSGAIIFPIICLEKTTKSELFSVISPLSRQELRLLDAALDGKLLPQLKRHEYLPKSGEKIDLHLAQGDFLLRLVPLCEKALRTEDSLDQWRRFGAEAQHAAKTQRASKVLLWLYGLEGSLAKAATEAIIEGFQLAAYDYSTYKSQPKKAKDGTTELIISGISWRGSQIELHKRAHSTCTAVSYARDLVNTPPSSLPPVALVREARQIARQSKRISLRILDYRQLERVGAKALLAVARGSSQHPYLIHLSFKPRQPARNQKQLVLIGKGITFDSGGLSLKPAKSMEDMKCDMAGAACVLAVMKALCEPSWSAAVKHTVHALIPAAENMVGSSSVKPGDIVRAMNGKTIEILNTDAEGRLILADALSYSAKLKPDVIIDLATLTGACIVAIGSHYAGLFANNEALSEQLQKLGRRCGEKLWPLPLAKEYRPLIDSSIADLQNIGNNGPGAVIGAIFLQEFVPQQVAWAHLDIAGPAFLSKADGYNPKGATGFGVRSMLQYLSSDGI